MWWCRLVEEESAVCGRSLIDADDVGSATDDEVGGVGLSTPPNGGRELLWRIFFVLDMDAKASLSLSDDELSQSSNAFRGRPRRCTIYEIGRAHV